MNRYGTTLLACLLLWAPELSAQEPTDQGSAVNVGARVRVKVGFTVVDTTRWYTGKAVLMMKGCTWVQLDRVRVGADDVEVDPDTPIGDGVIAESDAVTRIEVSSLYDGSFVPDEGAKTYSPGASLDGEEWIPVPLEIFREQQPDDC